MASASVAQVLEALSALYSSTDPRAKKEATRWLEAFQKQPDAWAAADYLIKADNANMETRLFAAQTFRQKVVYDLRDLNTEARVSLRDSLVGLLTTEATRQKAIMVQLCLALADLAIQMPEWKTAVQDMVNKFGSTPETAACLLEFLTVLPEEIDGNNRLPLTDKEYKAQSAALLEQNAAEVMKLLIVYMQSSAGNTDLQEQVFRCLASWVRTGDVDINMFADSPLLDMTFEGLGHDMLFEAAVDLASEIIYETREVNDSKAIIEKIYPRFEPLLPKLKMAKEEEDSDAVRGYCRLFVSAGEAYVSLIAKHPDTFRAIMEGIMECTAYQDLDIVPITFKFWYELTNTLTTESYAAGIPALSHYYEALVDIIIQHLHYPEDTTDWTAEQRDDFREFRHEMGDTLKDCCRVLSAERCLSKALVQLQTLLNQPEPASWQQIEAPIFSLRSMGSEVSEDENKVLPQILDLLSKLPEHPKIRYAATLVISRYSLWTRHHPQFITYQLNFISAGFQDAEVAAASALALKHLCKDCNELLIDYLSDLHPFYTSMIRSLPFLDALEVTEAVAHVLAVIPVNGLQNALQQFCLPLAQGLHSIASKEKAAATREDCTKAGDLLELISVFLEVIHPDVPLGQPHPCVNFVNELWPIFDLCLKNYGDEDVVCEQLGKCLRACVQSYGLHFVPMLPQLVERLVSGFEHSGLSVYLYVSSKIIREYAEGSAENASACFGLVERLSTTMFTMIREKNMNDIPDVVEDYFRMVTCLLERAPTHLVQSMLLPSVFQAGLAGLAMEESKALTAVVTFYRRLLGIALSVDELVPGDAPRTAAAIGQNGARIIELFKQFGGDFVRVLFDGLFYHYNWETIPDVATIIKSLAQILPAETSQWVVGIINSLSEDSVPAAERNDFLQQYMSAIQEKHWAKARRVLSDFIISYRRKNALRTGRE